MVTTVLMCGKVVCLKVVTCLCTVTESGKAVHVWPLHLAGIALLSPTTMFSSDSRPPPQRTDSINTVHASYFSSVDEEMRDCKRVQRQGQEEDLREALSRMMTRVEEMVRYHWKSSPLPSYCNLEVVLINSSPPTSVRRSNRPIKQQRISRRNSHLPSRISSSRSLIMRCLRMR